MKYIIKHCVNLYVLPNLKVVVKMLRNANTPRMMPTAKHEDDANIRYTPKFVMRVFLLHKNVCNVKRLLTTDIVANRRPTMASINGEFSNRFSSDIPMYHKLFEYFSISQKVPIKHVVHKQVTLAREESLAMHRPLCSQILMEHTMKSFKSYILQNENSMIQPILLKM